MEKTTQSPNDEEDEEEEEEEEEENQSPTEKNKLGNRNSKKESEKLLRKDNLSFFDRMKGR